MSSYEEFNVQEANAQVFKRLCIFAGVVTLSGIFGIGVVISLWQYVQWVGLGVAIIGGVSLSALAGKWAVLPLLNGIVDYQLKLNAVRLKRPRVVDSDLYTQPEEPTRQARPRRYQSQALILPEQEYEEEYEEELEEEYPEEEELEEELEEEIPAPTRQPSPVMHPYRQATRPFKVATAKRAAPDTIQLPALEVKPVTRQVKGLSWEEKEKQVRDLHDRMKWSRTMIIQRVWRCQSGDNEGWRQACKEFDQIIGVADKGPRAIEL